MLALAASVNTGNQELRRDNGRLADQHNLFLADAREQGLTAATREATATAASQEVIFGLLVGRTSRRRWLNAAPPRLHDWFPGDVVFHSCPIYYNSLSLPRVRSARRARLG